MRMPDRFRGVERSIKIMLKAQRKHKEHREINDNADGTQKLKYVKILASAKAEVKQNGKHPIAGARSKGIKCKCQENKPGPWRRTRPKVL